MFFSFLWQGLIMIFRTGYILTRSANTTLEIALVPVNHGKNSHPTPRRRHIKHPYFHSTLIGSVIVCEFSVSHLSLSCLCMVII
tara:strand:+ start:244 stop:495 length:252 start_codon:yes stop_codon:yes gene_type:complete